MVMTSYSHTPCPTSSLNSYFLPIPYHKRFTANSPNAVVLPYFAMFIAVWSALVLKHWKRVEKTTALEWGMIGFEDEEAERPQFVGEKRPSAVTGKRYTHFPTWKRAVRGVKTQGVVISLVLVVLALIACIYTIKFVVTWTTAISYNSKGLVSSSTVCFHSSIHPNVHVC